MSKLFNWAAARLVAAFALALPLAAMAVTTTGYEDFGDTAGVVLWRGTEANFHASTVINVAADGTLGDPYVMVANANNNTTSWQRFASNQPNAYTSPGILLVYDTPGTGDGYKYNPNCTFGPLSFGGMWVKTLAINGLPFSILGSGDRKTEFGASGKSTLFRFDASYTINRQGTTTFYGDATVDIAQGATFTAQAYSGQAVAVDSAATLKLKGAGTLAVTTMNVNGTLDLSETTRPTISGNVTLVGTIVLPEGTEVSAESPFTVCSGTLSAANAYVKIGDAEAVEKRIVVSGGAITALSDPAYEFTENYPTVVPAGEIFTFIGGETAATATTASGVTVNGTLKTRGYISLAGLTTAKESMLEVVDGTATVTASAKQALSGDITIDTGATMVNTFTEDALNYGWAEYIYVYGTLDMGSTRWTVGNNARIYLYEDGLITGAGQGSNGAIDITSSNVRVIASGDSTISANMRVRAENVPVEATEGKTLTISGLINDGVGYSQPGSITKQNSGTLVLTTAPTFTKALKLEAGTLELGGTAASASVTVAASAATVAASSGSTLTGELIFDSHIPSAANKTLIASEAFNGAVVLTGTISSAADITGLGNEVILRDFTGFLDKSASTSGIKVKVEGTFTQSNGWSYNSDRVYLAEIKGNGTMTQSGAQAQLYEVGSIENFTGTFNLTSARIKSNNNAVLDKAQTIATLTVAKTLTVNGGSLTGDLVAKDVAVTVDGTPAVGDVLVPVTGTVSVTGTVTVNGDEVAVECVAGEGVKFVAPLVTINVPKVANTTVAVSVGGSPVSPATEGESTNTYSVVAGSTVTVTYSSDDYEVTGGTFEFTASEGYTVDTTGVTTAQYVASITVGETTTKYTTLQAAVTAAAAINNGKMLLLSPADGMVATIPAPASGGRVQFYIAANGNAEGTVNAPAGDYIMTTASETIQIGSTDYGATKYTVVEAAVAVTIGTFRSLYGAPYISDAVSAAIAGGLGSTIEFVNGTDSTPYVSALEASGFTLENNIWTFTTLPVAKVTHGVIETSYLTLATAFANVEDGDTITLLDAVALDSTVVITNSVTLDLNGNDIAATGVRALWIKSGAVSITGEGVVSANGGGLADTSSVIRVGDGTTNANAASLTIGADVTIASATCYGVTAFGKNTPGITLVVNGTVSVTGTASAISGNGSSGLASAYITVNEGANVSAITDAGIYFPGTGTLDITGGTITGPTAVYVKCGTVNISGGTLTGTANKSDYAYKGNGLNATGDALVIDTCGYPGNPASVSVTGGTFTSQNADAVASYKKSDDAKYADDTENEAATGFVSGGTFNTAVEETYCAEGYEPTDDGSGHYTVRVDRGWIYEAADYPGYTGSWSNDAEYVGGKVKIEDGNTYTAAKPSGGQMVTVAMELSFDDANDEEEAVGEAKAAIRLASGETSGTYQFQLYTSDGANMVWTNATATGVEAMTNVDYTIVFVLDLTNKLYTASIVTDNGATTNALSIGGSVTEIPFAYQGTVTPVQQIDFVGSGSVTSIKGSYEDVPAPAEEFVDGEEIGSVTLDTDKATWLNGQNNYKALVDKIKTMTQEAFNNAYLLNLDITDPEYDGTFSFEVTDFTVGDAKVTVEVTLTRKGKLAGGINGTLKLTGTADLATAFEDISATPVGDDDFSDGDTATWELTKGSAKFFLPVIE